MFSACSFPVLAISVTECIDKIITIFSLIVFFNVCFRLSTARGLQIVFNGPLLNCFICCSKPEQQKVQLHPIAVSHSWKCRRKNIHFLFVFLEIQEKHFFEMQKDSQSKAKLRRCVCRVRTLWVEKVWAQPDLSRYRIAPKGCCLREVGRFTSR